MIRKLGVLLISLCAAWLAAGSVHAQEARNPAAPPTTSSSLYQSALAGPWKGVWSSPDGSLYHAQSHWDVKQGGSLEGHILWTLRRSPRDNEQQKIGMTGREYVRGKFDFNSKVLSMEGYRKEDPNGILGLDKYRLILTENLQVMAGPTWSHGSWKGLFFLTR